jgi:hypothetical protein
MQFSVITMCDTHNETNCLQKAYAFGIDEELIICWIKREQISLRE